MTIKQCPNCGSADIRKTNIDMVCTFCNSYFEDIQNKMYGLICKKIKDGTIPPFN